MIFDLNKEAAKVAFKLEKGGAKGLVAAVGLNMDISGSTRDLYRRGTMQGVVQRIMPVALNFDDNGELDLWAFADGEALIKLDNVTRANYNDYVQRNILNNRNVPLWGGTDYSPVFRENLTEYGILKTVNSGGGGFFGFKKESSGEVIQEKTNTGYPAVIYHCTDGENSRSDRRPTEELIRQCEQANANIYFHLIGIGPDGDFSFINEMADKYGNCGSLEIRNIDQMVQTDEIYDLLLPTELMGWLRAKKS